MNTDKQQKLGTYYLRLGVGFYTCWFAWDMIPHQSQWRAFLEGFPLVGQMAQFWLIIGFVLFLVLGIALLTGWMNRAATLTLLALLILSILPLGFVTPKINAVLGPFRALMVKNLVWIGACLVLLAQPSDPYQPEQRKVEGYPAWKEKSKLVFRLLLGSYFIWDGLLRLIDSSGYATLLSRAFAQLPIISLDMASSGITLLAIVQILAGILLMAGIQFKWALWVVVFILGIQLLGINWHATKGLLRAGGRFMMRDIITITSCIYFLLTGPGMPVLQIKLQKGYTPSATPPEPPGDRLSQDLF